MKLSDHILKTLLASIGLMLFSAPLLAQDDLMTMEEVEEGPTLYTSEIEVGGGYVSDDSFKFGEYNGLDQKGLFGIANVRVRKYVPLENFDGTYWDLDAKNLALDSRSITGEFSQSNLFRVMFNYDQIPHRRFDDGRTPFLGAGTADQTLPAGWVAASSTAGMTNLLTSLNAVNIDTERKRFGGAFTWHVTDRWQVQGKYQHENKDGADTIGAVFGSSGGNPRASILARPIDYETNDFNINVAYTGEKGQYSLGYHLSLFNNNDNGLLWDNPYDNPQWDAGANYSDGARGQMGSEPDNKAWQVNFAGGYNVNMRTRVTANISYGQMTQNQTFLPYSSVFTAAIPLPRNSLDGEIATLYANFNLTTRLTDRLGVTARYTYDNRDNNTPTDIYVRIPGDAVAQGGLIDSNARVNWPYSLKRHKLDVEGNYRLMNTMRLAVGYVYESKHRDFTEVEDTDEHTGKIRLNFTPTDFASGWVRYQHSMRRGSAYVSNQPLLTGHNPAYIADITINNPDELYENDPLMRKYHIADRNRDQVAAAVNFYPSDVVSVTLSGQYNNDDFLNTQDGLQESKNGNVSLDGAYTPNNKISFHAYVTYENYDYKQRGFYHPGFAGALTPTTDRIAQFGDNWWTQRTKDDIYTGGAGVDWTVIKDKFKVSADFLASHAITKTTPNSDGLTFLPLPDLKSDLYRINVTAEYNIRENMGVRFRYLFERFDSSDFALDLVTVNTLSNVILLGNGTPNYSDHVVGVSYFYNWQ